MHLQAKIPLTYTLSMTVISFFSSVQCSSHLSFLQHSVIPSAPGTEATVMTAEVNGVGVNQASKLSPNTPDPHTMPNPDYIAPG